MMPPTRAIGVMTAACLLFAAVGYAEDYQVRLERPFKAGDRLGLVVKAGKTETQRVSAGDKVVEENASTLKAHLEAQMEILAVIIRNSDQIKGIFTGRDLLHCIAAGKKDLAAIPLGQVMSSPINSCCLADDVRQCAETLQQGHIRHLVVIEDGAVVGVIGLRDLLALRLES